MPSTDHYLALLDRSKVLVNELSADAEALAAFTRAHNFSADFELLHEGIASRLEAKLILLAVREYQFALSALAAGMYRHAFISLRLFFELSLAAIFFSASEIKYRRWANRSEDIVWSALVDRENGVYTISFISAFDKELSAFGKQYSALAEKTYRECSEHVHGNIHTHPEDGAPLTFSREKVLSWVGLADTVRLCIIFAYGARFLRLMSTDDRNKLEALFVETLGTLPPIQNLFSK
jgi:hypothetical protein